MLSESKTRVFPLDQLLHKTQHSKEHTVHFSCNVKRLQVSLLDSINAFGNCYCWEPIGIFKVHSFSVSLEKSTAGRGSSNAELACKTFQVKEFTPCCKAGRLLRKKSLSLNSLSGKKITRMKRNLVEKSVNVRSRLDS